MSDLTIIVGDCSSYLADYSQSIDKNAYLIDGNNLNQNHQGVVYTSLADLNAYTFFSFLMKADKIIYAPPDSWSDGRDNTYRYSMSWITERYIITIANLKQISIINLPKLPTYGLNSVEHRTDNSKKIWAIGCSTTAGVGVAPEEKYSNLISKYLDYPVTNLSSLGSSIGWAADQILQMDIRLGDLIIWGLTTSDRFTWYINDKVNHIGVGYYKINPEFDKVQPLLELDSEHRWYESAKSILQVINFCSKMKATLILANIHGNIETVARYSNHPGFVMLHGNFGMDFDSDFLDYGSDNCHPGPKTHKLYADMILDKIKKLGWQ